MWLKSSIPGRVGGGPEDTEAKPGGQHLRGATWLSASLSKPGSNLSTIRNFFLMPRGLQTDGLGPSLIFSEVFLTFSEYVVFIFYGQYGLPSPLAKASVARLGPQRHLSLRP